MRGDHDSRCIMTRRTTEPGGLGKLMQKMYLPESEHGRPRRRRQFGRGALTTGAHSLYAIEHIAPAL